jgi:hypothetical protein
LAEKNASMNRLLELMISQQSISKGTIGIEQKDEYYDESVERIKNAMFKQIDIEEGLIPAEDPKENNSKDEVIDAEYTQSENVMDIDLSDVQEEKEQEEFQLPEGITPLEPDDLDPWTQRPKNERME